MKKIVASVVALTALALLYMGGQWQHEIALLCVTNGWTFGWPFSMLWSNPWQAMDFFRALQDACFLASVAVASALGYWLHSIRYSSEKNG